MLKPLGWMILALILLTTVDIVQAKEAKYVGVKRCRRCHKKDELGNQYARWKKLKHYKAYKNLAKDKALEVAKKAGVTGNPQESDKCLKCHTTAFGEDKSKFDDEFQIKYGVQCESCHGAGSLYTKESIMKDCKGAEKKGLIAKPDEKVCTKCHNEENPNWDTTRYKLKDGTTVGFDFEQAKKKTEHPRPKKK